MNNPFFCNWRTVSLAVPALMMVLAPVARAADGWMTNYGEAKTLAAKETKDILMDFTGSDWCVACAALKKEVFSQDVFRQEAPKHFVLLMLDYPQQKPLSAELTAQNENSSCSTTSTNFPRCCSRMPRAGPMLLLATMTDCRGPRPTTNSLPSCAK